MIPSKTGPENTEQKTGISHVKDVALPRRGSAVSSSSARPAPADALSPIDRARASTGPRTAEGKVQSRVNALKHGLLAETVVVSPTESPEEFFELYADMHRDLNPEGRLEETLVDRIITLTWRLCRATRIDRELMSLHQPAIGGACALALSFRRDAEGADVTSKLCRYEGHLDRSLLRTLHELQRIQAARRSGTSPALPGLDVHLDLTAT